MRVKTMLHPTLAPRLRGPGTHIDANVAGFISWERLIEALRESRNLHPEETVEAFVLTDDGVHVHVKRER